MVAMQETGLLEDADLVGLCLHGDRDAFGQIVERYRSLVCALAYSACGDISRSEDLAQETFIAAWRQLASLKEPAKLKHWLCGIVRNLIHHSVRAQTRNPLASAVVLEEEVASGSEWEVPSDEAMSKEEEAILWRVLETLPRTYRDPLVLYYRSGDSTAEVAEALELSEEAVRQRLARGRAMLSERMTRLVESGLRRSNPTKAFTVGVLAALPLASAQAGVVSGAVATAKGTGALKATSGLGPILATLTGVLTNLAAFIGLWGYIQNTRTRRERRFIAWTCLGLVAWGIALGVGAGLVAGGGSVFGLRINRGGVELSNAIRLSLVWLAFAGPLDAYAIWIALRQKRIRAEDSQAAQRPLEASRRGYRLTMYGSMFAMVFGTTSWLFLTAQRAQDWMMLAVLVLLCSTGWLVCAGLAVKRPKTETVTQVFIWLWWGLAFLNLAVFNLRWSTWQNIPAPLAPPAFRAFVNVLICVFFGSVRAGWYLKRRLLKTATVKRDSLVAVAAYAVIVPVGLALYKGVKVGDVPQVQRTQLNINEIQRDGMIRCQGLMDFRNDSHAPQRKLRFISSDFAQVEQISGPGGQPLPFRVKHQKRIFAYVVPLREELLPGRSVFLKTNGYLTNQIHQVGTGEFEYSLKHWPANGVTTLCVETYRLPSGARILETTPVEMKRRQLPDARLELRAQKIIPPDGSITVRIRFQQSPP